MGILVKQQVVAKGRVLLEGGPGLAGSIGVAWGLIQVNDRTDVEL